MTSALLNYKWLNRPMTTPQKKILIYRLGSLGDTVIALPAFHKIHNTFQDADITLLTNHPINTKAAPLESILGNGYFFHRVINYPIGTRNPLLLLKLIKEIRELNIDILIYLISTRRLKTTWATKISILRDKWFFKAAGVKRIVGIPNSKEELDVCIDTNTGRYEWEAKRLMRRLESLGTVTIETNNYWDLRFTDEELVAANKALSPCSSKKSIMAVCTGTQRQSNDWGEANWLKLFQQLKITLSDWQLVFVGANEDLDRANKCLHIWGGEGINLCGLISPRVSGIILKRAAIFIGHDSGPMHLAACVGIPCVAIFSARNLPGQWYPRGNFNKVIYHKTDCAGCGLEVCVEQKKKCILSITVNEVQNAIMEILARNQA